MTEVLFKFFFVFFKDMKNGDRYSESTFDYILNYLFYNYLRVIFKLKMRI